MTHLTDVEVADFRRLAQADGQTLTMEEARTTAIRLLLLYQHLAKPTPLEKPRSSGAVVLNGSWSQDANLRSSVITNPVAEPWVAGSRSQHLRM
jgi:hypothetical protein